MKSSPLIVYSFPISILFIISGNSFSISSFVIFWFFIKKESILIDSEINIVAESELNIFDFNVDSKSELNISVENKFNVCNVDSKSELIISVEN